MGLEPGSRLGDFEIRDRIGVGGMGEVYLARDGRLGRDVAIKVLPEHLAADPDRLSRFEREARLLASLNHPNIATIHGVDQIDDVCFLVLELVKGDSLSSRVEEGPLPMREALGLCRQIAAGMEAAHERGVIHRDLKPANVCLMPDGTVKVLDFGLAKSLSGGPAGSDVSRSASMSDSFEVTADGVILGTTAYMSPEQARGKAIDRRTDIWAFGCVLYELLTGRRPFVGEGVTDILASILKQEPEWELLPDETSERVRLLLHRCLEKDPMQRLRDIGDARITLEEELGLRADPASSIGQAAAPASERPVRTIGGAGLVGIAAASMAAGAVIWSLVGAGAGSAAGGGGSATPSPVTRLSMLVPPEQEIGTLCISADGRTIVYDTDLSGSEQEWGQLWVRSLDAFEAHPLAGTRGADSPAISPDGRWIVYFAWDDKTFSSGKLRKIALNGGPAVTLLDRLDAYTPAVWLSDDELLVAATQEDTLSRLPAGGGPLELVATVETGQGEVGISNISPLPGSEALLVTWFALVDGRPLMQLRLLHLADGKMTTLVEDGANGRYVPTGHIVFTRQDALLAVPFDVGSLAVTGGVVPLMSGLQTSSSGWDSDAFAISDAGHLVYMPGFVDYGGRRIMTADREGNVEEFTRQERPYDYGLAYSPDGRWLALGLDDANGIPQVWLLDVESGAQSPVSKEGEVAIGSVWSPDSSRIAWWQWKSGEESAIWWGPADRSEQPTVLLEIEGNELYPEGWSPDGAWLAYRKAGSGETRAETWLLKVDGSGETRQLLASPSANFVGSRFSPDGRWIAYSSDESGQNQVYVRAFDSGDGTTDGARYPVSTDGGAWPIWSPLGDELLFWKEDRYLAVTVATEGGFSASTPQPALVYADVGAYEDSPMAVSPDGQRFAFIRSGEGEDVTPQIDVILNWVEELRRTMEPSGR